jgi:hypothetical protein
MGNEIVSLTLELLMTTKISDPHHRQRLHNINLDSSLKRSPRLEQMGSDRGHDRL